MSDTEPTEKTQHHVLSPEPVEDTPLIATVDGSGDGAASEAVPQPAKVMRIGAMIRQLLEEVRRAPLDDAGRARLAEVYATSVRELTAAVSPDLQQELARLVAPFLDGDGVPTEAELRIAQAQLVGWLEGLFHGIQATLFAQQMEARQQLDELRQRSLPPGSDAAASRPGTYL